MYMFKKIYQKVFRQLYCSFDTCRIGIGAPLRRYPAFSAYLWQQRQYWRLGPYWVIPDASKFRLLIWPHRKKSKHWRWACPKKGPTWPIHLPWAAENDLLTTQHVHFMTKFFSYSNVLHCKKRTILCIMYW